VVLLGTHGVFVQVIIAAVAVALEALVALHGCLQQACGDDMVSFNTFSDHHLFEEPPRVVKHVYKNS